jgi:hypothetical protein
MNPSQKCLLDQYFRSRIFREKSAIDSLSRKTTRRRHAFSATMAGRQVVRVADRSASGNEVLAMGQEDSILDH